MKRVFAVCLLLVAESLLAQTEQITALLDAPPFDHAVSFVLVEDEDGTIVFERNSKRLAIPASVRKLFSAATVSQCVPLDTNLETQLLRSGEDLVLRGGGDPSFGAERHGLGGQYAFVPFIDALRSRRIRSVRDVIVDVSLFDRVTVPYNWKVGNLTSVYAAPADAIAFAENEESDVPAVSPAIFAGYELKEALEAAGITVRGTVRMAIEPHPATELLARAVSPPVHYLLHTVLRNSHNLYAEMLFKRAAAGAEPASYDEALEIERRFLTEEVGIDRAEFRFVDGSGLAPDNLVTPSAVVKLLRWMNHPMRWPAWSEILAQPGGPGTLRLRLTELAPTLRAKTGSVNAVNALAGVVRRPDGRPRYFAIVINHHLASGGNAVQLIDAIVREIAR